MGIEPTFPTWQAGVIAIIRTEQMVVIVYCGNNLPEILAPYRNIHLGFIPNEPSFSETLPKTPKGKYLV